MTARSAIFSPRILGALTRAATRQALRDEAGRQTSPDDLRAAVLDVCGDTPVVIASNREPYQHVRADGGLRVLRSPGGLASALDSVARATGATWVAQASGTADREGADADGRVRVPPGEERYTLQRIWLEPEELGRDFRRFTNGCLWPLCHVVYVRPQFRAEGWKAYQDVNRIFADAILASVGDGPALVLLQDFHLALCAAHLRARRPDLTIVHFWHIPWPNPEVFRILPWKQEVLEGLLACDVVGFHIPYHGMNFVDTVARELEVRVLRERGAIQRRGRRTYVRSYPIGPDSAEISLAAGTSWAVEAAAALRRDLGIGDARVILGVDRLDYTKGIPERMAAFERFLERRPGNAGRVVLVQVGVPTRVDLPEYQAIGAKVEEDATRLNRRFGGRVGPVVHLILRQLDFRELIPYYVLADVLAVTALHDGMNLVAKEYVAAKNHLDGVLVLSPYAGASRELEHAIQASPYDTERLAEALANALALAPGERADRMLALREVVASRNVYDWASKILRDVRRLHLIPGRVRPPARP